MVEERGRQDKKKQLKRGEDRMKKIVEERGRQNEKNSWRWEDRMKRNS